MMHLTLTGMYAGHPLCGIDKAEARARGDDFAHAAYLSDVVLAGPDICPDCLRDWYGEDEAAYEQAAAQPALFPDEAPARDRKHYDKSSAYTGGQPAMLCARCFDVAGPFVRSREGIAYCVPCARIAQKGK